MATGSRRSSGRSERAQTSIDFLIGVGVFLLAVTFVFATIPGMIDPFSEGQEETLVADRVATQLAESMLGERDESSTLNETCTYAFFDVNGESGDDCPVGFNTGDELPTRMGIDDRYRLNVTLRRTISDGSTPEILCTDGMVVGDCGTYPDPLAAGPPATTSGDSMTSARRTVSIDGKDVTLVVRLW